MDENKIFKPGPAPEDKGEEFTSQNPETKPENGLYGYESINLDRINLVKIPEGEDREILTKNLDKYELEKIQDSLDEVKVLADSMERYISVMKDLEKQKIHVTGVQHTFDKLRFPGAVFDPSGEGEFGKMKKIKMNMNLILDKINTLKNNGEIKEI